jgi:hypothetical protein
MHLVQRAEGVSTAVHKFRFYVYKSFTKVVKYYAFFYISLVVTTNYIRIRTPIEITADFEKRSLALLAFY